MKRYGFVSFARNLFSKHGKQFLDTATKTGLDSPKTASKKLVHKVAEETCEFIGNKINDKSCETKSFNCWEEINRC